MLIIHWKTFTFLYKNQHIFYSSLLHIQVLHVAIYVFEKNHGYIDLYFGINDYEFLGFLKIQRLLNILSNVHLIIVNSKFFILANSWLFRFYTGHSRYFAYITSIVGLTTYYTFENCNVVMSKFVSHYGVDSYDSFPP